MPRREHACPDAVRGHAVSAPRKHGMAGDDRGPSVDRRTRGGRDRGRETEEPDSDDHECAALSRAAEPGGEYSVPR
ncbi:hypothetical protein GCM10027563_35400 [Parasphingorhabdus pacifica]